jgi:hypothetical protein
MSYRDVGDSVMDGRSSIFGAMMWMLLLSFLLTLLLGWVPFVGPFIGPLVGGYVGGRRAGTIGRALIAAILPAVFLSLFIWLLGAVATGLSGVPFVGAIAALFGAMAGLILLINNGVLFAAAVVGGWVRQSEMY